MTNINVLLKVMPEILLSFNKYIHWYSYEVKMKDG